MVPLPYPLLYWLEASSCWTLVADPMSDIVVRHQSLIIIIIINQGTPYDN
jgi:hypothetical protein